MRVQRAVRPHTPSAEVLASFLAPSFPWMWNKTVRLHSGVKHWPRLYTHTHTHAHAAEAGCRGGFQPIAWHAGERERRGCYGNRWARHGNLHFFWSTLSVRSWAAYQRDDGGTGASERNDVEVVGEVELWREKKRIRKKKDEIQEEERSGQRPLTSLVLQMSPSVAPQAFPGEAFQGIIPTGSERWNIRGLRLPHRRQEAFSSPETVIEGIMN